jgi:hypothetical protein
MALKLLDRLSDFCALLPASSRACAWRDLSVSERFGKRPAPNKSLASGKESYLVKDLIDDELERLHHRPTGLTLELTLLGLKLTLLHLILLYSIDIG